MIGPIASLRRSRKMKMLKIENLHAEIDGKPILMGRSPTVIAVEAQKLLGISLEGSVG